MNILLRNFPIQKRPLLGCQRLPKEVTPLKASNIGWLIDFWRYRYHKIIDTFQTLCLNCLKLISRKYHVLFVKSNIDMQLFELLQSSHCNHQLGLENWRGQNGCRSVHSLADSSERGQNNRNWVLGVSIYKEASDAWMRVGQTRTTMHDHRFFSFFQPTQGNTRMSRHKTDSELQELWELCHNTFLNKKQSSQSESVRH